MRILLTVLSIALLGSCVGTSAEDLEEQAAADRFAELEASGQRCLNETTFAGSVDSSLAASHGTFCLELNRNEVMNVYFPDTELSRVIELRRSASVAIWTTGRPGNRGSDQNIPAVPCPALESTHARPLLRV